MVAVQTIAVYSRYMRSSMLEVKSSDYLRTARAKGISERPVIVKHALRNALIPITTFAAIDIGAIIGGLIITERIFEWPGMGEYFLTAFERRRLPAAAALDDDRRGLGHRVQPDRRPLLRRRSTRGSALSDLSISALEPSPDPMAVEAPIWPRASPPTSMSPARLAGRRFRRHRAAVFGAVSSIIITLVVILAPWIAPYGETELVGDPGPRPSTSATAVRRTGSAPTRSARTCTR